MRKERYFIVDWHGNQIFIDRQESFESFEEAWSVIYWFESDEEALDEYLVLSEDEYQDLKKRTMIV
jgi:hypothetical protein